MGSLQTRLIRPDEVDDFTRSVARAFGGHPVDEAVTLYRPAADPDRSVAVFDDEDMVGTALWDLYDMVVPGGALPSAGVTAVGVHPTHRRRGLMTAMLRHQMDQIHERGIPLAALTASESTIYGRFGYGIASFAERWSIQRHHTAFAVPFEPKGRLRFVPPGRIKDIFPEVERRALSNRPGSVQKPEYEWDVIVADPESFRQGCSALFHVVYEDEGRADGYVTYCTKNDTLQVNELMTATDDAHAALWRYCFDVDLMTNTLAYAQPVDDPLVWMLANPGRLKREVRERMWLRLVDVPKALSGRTYSREGSIALRLADPFCPWNEGTLELEAHGGEAECRRSGRSPDLALSSAELAAVYLGGQTFGTLSHAGRVEECTPGSLALADSMFAYHTQPWSPYGY